MDNNKTVQPHSDRPKILIVDDEQIVRNVCRSILEHAGYDVTEAASAEVALTLLADNRFPVVLTDILMPGMSGLDLLQEVRTMYPGTGVIVMTGSTIEDFKGKALASGADDFLSKPFNDLRLLTSSVARLLKR